METEIFNPHERPLQELPVIYGFNNGGPVGFMSGVLLASDGECLGGHCCTHEGHMRGDLGVIKGHRPDRHETFRAHYPDGYQMEFVSYADVEKHAGLNAAFKLHEQRNPASSEKEQA